MPMAINVGLQQVVDRYAAALSVPRLMLDLYPNPRPQGAPAMKYRTINPTVVLASIAAFEGFAEDLIATCLYADSHPMAYIASNSDLTNPTIKEVEDLLIKLFGVPQGSASAGNFKLAIVPPPLPNQKTSWWKPVDIDWARLARESADWMQVRHNLTHGVVTGLTPERWSGPANRRPNAGLASQVLQQRPQKTGSPKHSLNFWGAISCARIYSAGGTRLANILATARSETVNVSGVPTFLDV